MASFWPAAAAVSAKSKSSTSCSTTETRSEPSRLRSRGASSRSSSMAITRAACAASRPVIAPCPAPISTTVSCEMSPSAATMRRMAVWSRRKFWPSLGFWGMDVWIAGITGWMKAILRDVFQYREMKRAAQREAKLLVQAYGRVIGPGVKERGLAAALDLVHADVHEPARIAPAARVRMRAHATDLDEAGKAHALARHGDEPAVVEDAVEVAELDGAQAEGAGLGELGQGDHGGGVGGG